MASLKHLAALAALTVIGTPAAAVVVDFEAQPLGNNPNPLTISGATFTTVGGFNFIATATTNDLCASISATSPANCSRDLEVAFGGNASAISFNFVANNTNTIGADIGDVQIFSGVTLLGSVDVFVVDGTSATKDTVALTGFSNVTRIVISSTDFGGVLYDDFAFELDAVPEPSSWAMMIAGFGLAGAALRRGHRPALTAA